MPKTHYLKTWSEFYYAVKDGRKPFEIRQNDRHFEVGDTLVLEDFMPCSRCKGRGEYWPEGLPELGEAPKPCCDAPYGLYSGDSIQRVVTYITAWHQMHGVVVMGLKEAGYPQ